jgi:hypothetical protein
MQIYFVTTVTTVESAVYASGRPHVEIVFFSDVHNALNVLKREKARKDLVCATLTQLDAEELTTTELVRHD